MPPVVSRLLFCVLLCAVLIPLSGCGNNKTPEEPERSELEQYLDENPEAAARIDEDVESDEDDGEG